MDVYTATEEAYKKGYREGLYDGRTMFGASASWGSGTNPRRPCTECGYRTAPTKFCPNCGFAMKNPFPYDVQFE